MIEERLITRNDVARLKGAAITIEVAEGVRVAVSLAALRRLFRAVPGAYLWARVRPADMFTRHDTVNITTVSGVDGEARAAVRNYIIE